MFQNPAIWLPEHTIEKNLGPKISTLGLTAVI